MGIKQILKVGFTMVSDIIFIRDDISNKIFDLKDVIDLGLVLNMEVEELGITIPFRNSAELWRKDEDHESTTIRGKSGKRERKDSSLNGLVDEDLTFFVEIMRDHDQIFE
ncbi:hypothetical protein LIER_20760 [Lithospermum erythrorhizon]|uniref:Uncharacterized protein n=1 Tax=Lithospermum erythrorhizon TaxID=34254 RepID=A0AAV3QQ36_LITER